MAQAKQKRPVMETVVTVDGKEVGRESTVRQFSLDPNQMALAMAAQKAASEGKDAVTAARELREKQAEHEKDFMTAKRYCVAVANLERGHFEELDFQSLLDVVALSTKQVLDIENWKKQRPEA
jgi:hypothetical protein